jgi:MraZ protein
MFRGSSFHTIDVKGRLIIPARFRDVLKASGGDGVMVTKMDSSLFAYTYEGWKEVEARILAVAEKGESMRRFRRIFVGGASDCPCDKQGRILIPPLLREYAGVKKDIVLVGVLDHFEIWARQKWENENKQLEDDMMKEEVIKEIAKLGL